MSTEKKSDSTKISSRGGAREGSGRKKGSTNRYSSRDLLDALSRVGSGQEYVDQLAEDYWTARLSGDKMLGHKYHQLLAAKVFADQHTIEVDESTSADSRQHSFLKALEVMGNVMLNQDREDYDK